MATLSGIDECTNDASTLSIIHRARKLRSRDSRAVERRVPKPAASALRTEADGSVLNGKFDQAGRDRRRPRHRRVALAANARQRPGGLPPRDAAVRPT